MIQFRENVDLKNCTFILPSVAVGNVAQLTIDLLISSLKLSRVAHLSISSFIPIAGTDPYNEDSKEICTCADFYHSDEKKIIVLQIRSPLVKRLSRFLSEMKEFVKDQQISKVVILTSSYSHEIRDAQLKTVPLRYIPSEILSDEDKRLLNTLSWIQLEPKVVDFVDSQALRIPGGGFAKCLFEYLSMKNIPSIVLLRFCSEGNNIPEALDLLNYLNEFLSLIPNCDDKNLNIKYPPSWKFLFGNSPPSDIY